jgi:hypothetical protein
VNRSIGQCLLWIVSGSSEEQRGNSLTAAVIPATPPPLEAVSFSENHSQGMQYLQNCNFGLFACSLGLGMRHADNRLHNTACYSGQKGKALQMHY